MIYTFIPDSGKPFTRDFYSDSGAMAHAAKTYITKIQKKTQEGILVQYDHWDQKWIEVSNDVIMKITPHCSLCSEINCPKTFGSQACKLVARFRWE